MVVPGTGIHLNNVMGEEDLNPFGFHQHPAGRRMPSMMAPSVVMRGGEVELVLGSAGSNRIRSALLQTIVAVVDRGLGVREAVDAPRVHLEDGVVFAEPGIDVERLDAGTDLVELRRAEPVLRRSAGGHAPRRERHRRGRPASWRRGGERVRALATVAGAMFAGALATGCGGVQAADLFLIQRTGTTPHARLTMLVNEEGGVHCNAGPLRHLSDRQLVIAKATQEELHDAASSDLNLPPRLGSVYRYFLRDENGTVQFSDNSLKQPGVLHQLQLFVLQTAQQVCHLPE